MPLFHYTINGQTLAIRLPEHGGRIAEVQLDGKALVPAVEDMSHYVTAIALALLAHEVEEVHDTETNTIPFATPATPSAWADPESALLERGTL